MSLKYSDYLTKWEAFQFICSNIQMLLVVIIIFKTEQAIAKKNRKNS